MSEPTVEPAAEPASAPPVAAPKPARSRHDVRHVIWWLLIVLPMTALVFGGWWLWTRHGGIADRLQQQDARAEKLQARIDELGGEIAEMSDRQAESSRIADRNGTDLTAATSRIQQNEQLLGRLSGELAGGRARFQLAAVEQLLMLAGDRLLLEEDANAAARALESAEARLAQLADPSLFRIREAITAERSALLAVPNVDTSSAALVLGSLLDRVPQLPLRTRAPSHFHKPALRLSTETSMEQTRWWQRVWVAVRSTLSSLFTIRRDDRAESLRLLPPEQEAVVYHALHLKLEGARVALLRREKPAFRENLRSALLWLEEYFREDDPGVMAAKAELERLQSLELAPALPEIGRGLALLRARLDTAAP